MRAFVHHIIATSVLPSCCCFAELIHATFEDFRHDMDLCVPPPNNTIVRQYPVGLIPIANYLPATSPRRCRGNLPVVAHTPQLSLDCIQRQLRNGLHRGYHHSTCCTSHASHPQIQSTASHELYSSPPHTAVRSPSLSDLAHLPKDDELPLGYFSGILVSEQSNKSLQIACPTAAVVSIECCCYRSAALSETSLVVTFVPRRRSAGCSCR